MSRNRAFNVHDLYPEDYCFDQAAFEADPEGYQFTPDDIAYFNAMEVERTLRTIKYFYNRAEFHCILQGLTIIFLLFAKKVGDCASAVTDLLAQSKNWVR